MLHTFLKQKEINSIALKFFVWLDNLCYRMITKIAIIDNDGAHPKHRILDYHSFFSLHLLQTDTVLDVGCGNGSVAFDVALVAKEVVGIDIDKKNIENAKRTNSRANITYLIGDATTYPFAEKFDKIILSNVLEHIENRIDFLKKLHNISDTILLRIPMIDRDWVTVYKKEKGLEYRLDSTHFVEYTLNNLKDELIKSHWDIEIYSIQFGEFWGVLKSI
jgi:SAM-dependent methyltransferase